MHHLSRPFHLGSLPWIRPLPSWPPAQTLSPCLHAFQAGPVRLFVLTLPADPEPWIARLEAHASRGRSQQAARMRSRQDALRCLAAEALLRHALQEVHGLAPADLVFQTGRQGKPHLQGRPDIHFNLSHSGAWVLCALHDRPLGVDVEVDDRSMPAGAALSGAELARFRKLAPAAARDYFFRVWTLKESLMKALGLGLALDPAGLTIAFGAAGITASHHERPFDHWLLRELPMPAGVRAACCCRVPAFPGGEGLTPSSIYI